MLSPDSQPPMLPTYWLTTCSWSWVSQLSSQAITQVNIAPIIQKLPSQEDGGAAAQALFGMRALKETEQAILEPSVSSAALQLILKWIRTVSFVSLPSIFLCRWFIKLLLESCVHLSMAPVGKGTYTTHWLFMPLKAKKAPKRLQVKPDNSACVKRKRIHSWNIWSLKHLSNALRSLIWIA